MRRKLGILFLSGVTVLAGMQEAVRQFDGLKSSMIELTRAGLWSGLIVYAQPVTDGKVPSPQIYYLIPQTQIAPDAQGSVLVDNRPNHNATTPKPETKNNHSAEDVALSMNETAMLLAATRGVEDTANSEPVIDELPLDLIASNPAPAAKLEKKRVYKLEKKRVSEKVAKHELFARMFKQDAVDVIAKALVEEFDAAKLEAELAQLAAAQEQLENSKLKSSVEPESVEPEKDLQRRIEIRVKRRAIRPERVERTEVLPRFAEKRVIALPDMSSIGCEKAATAKAVAAPAPAVVAAVTTDVKIVGEPLVIELATPAAISIPTSTSWALGCDSEPEQK